MTADARSVRDACLVEGPRLSGVVLHNTMPVDGALLLWAIAGNESGFGKHRLYARHEPAYMPPNGTYYRRSEVVQRLWTTYGVLAGCSLGSWQIMSVVAYELGFRDHPIRLQDDPVGAKWAAKCVERIVARGAKTLSEVFDAYNTGWHRDTNIPAAYMARGCKFYDAGWPSLA